MIKQLIKAIKKKTSRSISSGMDGSQPDFKTNESQTSSETLEKIKIENEQLSQKLSQTITRLAGARTLIGLLQPNDRRPMPGALALSKRPEPGRIDKPETDSELKAVKLHLGSGLFPLAGYEAYDFVALAENTTVADLRKLPLENDYADEIYSPSLEHLPHPETLTVLQEWYRVLKPGGMLQLTVPDLEWAARAWLDSPEKERWGYLLGVIYGTQHDICSVHYCAFTKERLENLLKAAGFCQIEVNPYWQIGHQRIWANAFKPLRDTTCNTTDDIESDTNEKDDYFAPASVHFDAVEHTIKLLHKSPLSNTDYNWIRREAEYQNYKKWHKDLEVTIQKYNEQIPELWKQIHEKGLLIEELTNENQSLNEVIRRQHEMIERLKKKRFK